MKTLDMASALAAVVVGLGLVLEELPTPVRATVVAVALVAYGSVAGRDRVPVAIGAVLVAAVLAPATPDRALALIVATAVVGAAVESRLPGRGSGDGRTFVDRLTKIDVARVEGSELADLVDREIGRAQRLDQYVTVVAVPLHDDERDVVGALDAVRTVVRAHDVIGYDEAMNRVYAVVVVPSEADGRVVATKIVNVRSIDGSHAQTCFYPGDGATADELLAPIDGRSLLVGRSAA